MTPLLARLARAVRTTLALVTLLTAARAGDVWRVGADFGSVPLTHALDAAADGDVLLLAEGVHHTDAVLGERSLTLVADGAARVRGHLRVTGDDPAVQVRLLGVEIEPAPWAPAAAVTVHDFAGRVWFEGCTLRGSDPYDAPYAPLAETGEALRVVHSSEVVLVACRLEGGTAAPSAEDGPPAGPGCAALLNVGSRVAAFGCSLRGGDGGSDHFGHAARAGSGGTALFQRAGGHSYLWQTRLVGGDGGFGPRSLDGRGGTGLRNEGWMVEARAARVEGGHGSDAGLHCELDGGRLRESNGWPRELVVSNPNLDDGQVTVMVRGIPGEVVALELGRDARWPVVGLRSDSVPPMLASREREVPLGIVPPSGTILRRFPTGALPAGTGSTLFAQVRHESELGIVRGPARLVVLLDADR